jgi:hypothetical protein
VLDAVHVRITTAMNETLLAHFTAEEVKALFSIGDLKVSGRDVQYW